MFSKAVSTSCILVLQAVRSYAVPFSRPNYYTIHGFGKQAITIDQQVKCDFYSNGTDCCFWVYKSEHSNLVMKCIMLYVHQCTNKPRKGVAAGCKS